MWGLWVGVVSVAMGACRPRDRGWWGVQAEWVVDLHWWQGACVYAVHVSGLTCLLLSATYVAVRVAVLMAVVLAALVAIWRC